MAAGEGQMEGMVDRVRKQGVHSTHYIMVRLQIRSILFSVGGVVSLKRWGWCALSKLFPLNHEQA